MIDEESAIDPGEGSPIPRQLTEGEFQATFTHRMDPISTSSPQPFDYWPYFEEIPPVDLRGLDFSGGQVDAIWQSSGGRYQHVMIRSNQKKVSLVLVLIVPEKRVYGHRILDLSEFDSTGR